MKHPISRPQYILSLPVLSLPNGSNGSNGSKGGETAVTTDPPTKPTLNLPSPADLQENLPPHPQKTSHVTGAIINALRYLKTRLEKLATTPSVYIDGSTHTRFPDRSTS